MQMQCDLNSVCSLATSWNLKLNIDKCVVMRFGGSVGIRLTGNYNKDGVPLKFVSSHRDLGVLVVVKLKFHDHVRSVVRKAGGMVCKLLRATVCHNPSFMVSLFVFHIRPIMDFCSCVWNVGYMMDVRLLESVQRRWTREVAGIGHLSYQERLRTLKLYSIYGRLMRADLIKCWKVFHSEIDVGLQDLFTMSVEWRTCGHPLKVVLPRCELELWRFFQVCVVQRWNALSVQAVMKTSLI